MTVESSFNNNELAEKIQAINSLLGSVTNLILNQDERNVSLEEKVVALAKDFDEQAPTLAQFCDASTRKIEQVENDISTGNKTIDECVKNIEDLHDNNQAQELNEKLLTIEKSLQEQINTLSENNNTSSPDEVSSKLENLFETLNILKNILTEQESKSEELKANFLNQLETQTVELKETLNNEIEKKSQDFESALNNQNQEVSKNFLRLNHALNEKASKFDVITSEELHQQFSAVKAETQEFEQKTNEKMEQVASIDQLRNIESQIETSKEVFEELKNQVHTESNKLEAQQSLTQEEIERRSVLQNKLEALEKDLQCMRENFSDNQTQTRTQYESSSEKSEKLAETLNSILEDLNSHKNTLGEKNKDFGEALDRLREKLSQVIEEKENLCEMLASSKEEYKTENHKLNGRIEEIQKKSEMALQIKSDELNALGKKYDTLESMKHSLETNISDIKDTKDAHERSVNHMNIWMKNQEKHRKNSYLSTAAVALLGCFAFFASTDNNIQTISEVESIVEMEEAPLEIDSKLDIADTDVIVENGLSEPELMEETVASAEIIEEAPAIAEPVIRVETAFVQNDEIAQQEEVKKSTEYIVQKNDNLWGIAKRFYGKGYLSTKIIEDNKLGNSDIKPGKVLRIFL